MSRGKNRSTGSPRSGDAGGRVNDTDYAASGRGAVTVIGKDGKVDFSSAAFAELAGQTVTITITAQGCQKDLTMSVTVPETLPAANSGGGGQVH